MRSDLGVCVHALRRVGYLHVMACALFFWEREGGKRGCGREEGVRTSVWEYSWS